MIFVDRVGSVAEAAELERAGADLVGVSLAPDPRFFDERTVTAENAARIARTLQRATLVAAMELSGDPGRILRTVSAVGARRVQPITGAIPPAGVRAALDEAGVGILYGGIEISHDDDPGWVFSAYADTPGLNAALFRADVLPEYRDSWTFLQDKAPEFDEEFQVGDLDALARERPLLVGLDFTPGNVAEIMAALPAVRGIALTLGGQARRGDVRFHSYSDALDVVRAAAPRGAPGRSVRR
ncbi:hypothetical protein ACPCHT_22950 [Nucisporomicrobium flavum]|uniref:hypothetical protein n=1 Tax=Nucisporomicrobium flavum TaxID=2785915 RepID=UPI003C2C214B